MMKVLDPASVYELTGDQVVKFIRRERGELVQNGTTNEELIEVLIDRIQSQNDKLHCLENENALVSLKAALSWLHSRTRARMNQGLQNTEEHHTTPRASKIPESLPTTLPCSASKTKD